ncbi:MAG: Re/Si-specific NAD(P)(+) transhydrogenase subunit alpha [Planctomycetales bacterium]|nr:Re/Si-specific NAD(P)(+) transhydrogenase subunit alpha [Planctomycetales bacterium]
MLVAVPKETFPGERRVCLIPADLPRLAKAGIEVLVERGAGVAAGFPDALYEDKGAKLADSREELWSCGDVIATVRTLGASPECMEADLKCVRPGQLLVGSCDPLGHPECVAQWAEAQGSLFALELIPRITRAQSMDVLSSMATVAGYRAVLQAAIASPRMFPMMMTAAGTLSAARVFVIGAGVAGLQAIATSRRLGAVVHAYDLRPDCREQVESLGGKFVVLELETGESQDQGGYAKAMGEDFYQRQQQLMAEVVAESDVVITTAAVPGRPSPRLISKEAVEGMAPGSVIVDLAAERGGNCELSQPDQRVEHHGVVIFGPTNLPSEAPTHASQMYSRNVMTLLLHVTKDGKLTLDLEDSIVKDTLAAHDGQVHNARLRDLLNLPPLVPVAAPTASEATTDEGSQPGNNG